MLISLIRFHTGSEFFQAILPPAPTEKCSPEGRRGGAECIVNYQLRTAVQWNAANYGNIPCLNTDWGFEGRKSDATLKKDNYIHLHGSKSPLSKWDFLPLGKYMLRSVAVLEVGKMLSFAGS